MSYSRIFKDFDASMADPISMQVILASAAKQDFIKPKTLGLVALLISGYFAVQYTGQSLGFFQSPTPKRSEDPHSKSGYLHFDGP